MKDNEDKQLTKQKGLALSIDLYPFLEGGFRNKIENWEKQRFIIATPITILQKHNYSIQELCSCK